MLAKTQDSEEFLYLLMEELSRIGAPVVFKGALVLKIHLNENAKNSVKRITKDIDANWNGRGDIVLIRNTLIKAVSNINSSYTVVVKRIPRSSKESAGFDIKDEKSVKITSIDLDLKDNPFYVNLTLDNQKIKCSSLSKIIADKFSAISTEKVYRRIKDILDIYLLSNLEDFSFEEVKEILIYDERDYGDFSTLLNNKEKIEHGYSRLKRVENKPEFEEVWNTIVPLIDKAKQIM